MNTSKTVAINLIALGSQVRESDVSLTNRYQTHLRDDMAAYGMQNPIEVSRPNPDGTYDLRKGGRRLAAAKHLGWTEIDIVYWEECAKP